MNINLTLFIQMINFFVAYILLSKGILAPVLRIIEQEAAYKKRLKNHIASEQLSIAEQEAEKQAQINHVKEYFQQHKPKPEVDLAAMELAASHQVAIDKKQLQMLVRNVTAALKSRLTDD